MSFTNHYDYTAVSNGRSNGRSSYQRLSKGRVTIAGIDPETGGAFRRVVTIVDGEIMDNRLYVGGKTIHHVAYGKFETSRTKAGRDITRFHPGSGKGRHGKSIRHCDLQTHTDTGIERPLSDVFAEETKTPPGWPGTCHS